MIVPRGMRRIEKVAEHSKMSVSMMFCGTAAGKLLPPMVVYKSTHLYENWTIGGPKGTVYSSTQSGWFDSITFETWFRKVYLPSISGLEGKKYLIGDNLASHFTPTVVALAKQHNVYFTFLPPNATHILQPLDVAVFGPVKKEWRQILRDWRSESRSPGTIPKTQFPTLVQRLWSSMSTKVPSWLQSGFLATGLSPFNPDAVVNKMPGQQNVGRSLDQSLVELLQKNRGQDKPKKKRGPRVEPGQDVTTVTIHVVVEDPELGAPSVNIDDPQPSTSTQVDIIQFNTT